MIIDSHVHVFPSLHGASGYPSAAHHARVLRDRIGTYWGRMVTNTLDEACKPAPGEDVRFRLGSYGRVHWRKAGRECWMQRFPTAMENMDWTPERMVACMDLVGVSVGILQAGYMEGDFASDYFARCVERFPERFVSTVTLDCDPARGTAHLSRQIETLHEWVRTKHARGVFQGFPRLHPVDDPLLDPLWQALVELGLPHIFLTGFRSRRDYLLSIDQLLTVRRRHPELKVVIGHLGGNVLPPGHPEHVDNPAELLPLLATPNTYFEVGYVLAYENRQSWGKDFEYPYPRHSELVRRVYDAVGAEGLIWGSDMPNLERTCTYAQCLETVRSHCLFLTEDEKSMVLGGNAARLFGLDWRSAGDARASMAAF